MSFPFESINGDIIMLMVIACLFLASECSVMFPSRLSERRLLVHIVAAQEPLALVTTFYVHPAHLASNLNPAYNARDQDRGI